MVSQISVVINTYNEEKHIKRLIESLGWANEIIVVDDGSTDKTIKILQNLKKEENKLKVFKHKGVGFVEPARNFAISKATCDWILILDADEEVGQLLVIKLQEIAKTTKQINYVRLPRRNLIFGHFMQYCGWWPDYNIRFFKRGAVSWTNVIHRPPKVLGEGLDLPAEKEYAIVHHSYETVSQFIGRMNRYTTIEAEELTKQGYEFKWQDLFEKPLNEFLSRFFALEGYKDGLHGLALSLIQAFSFLVVFLKVWEIGKFKEEDITVVQVQTQKEKSVYAINYWFKKITSGGSFLDKLFKK